MQNQSWLPVNGYVEDARLITEAFGRLAEALRARPLQLQVQASAGEGTGTVTRLVASRGRARVQIETTPVMRGYRLRATGKLPSGCAGWICIETPARPIF